MKHTTIKFTITLLSLSTVFLLASCGNSDTEEDTIITEPINHQAIGDSLSTISQQTLLANVAREMKSGGPVHAIDFCNLNASPLMDSLSKQYDVEISRITAQARNPSNKASASELELLQSMMNSNSKDTLIHSDASTTYYKSIKLGMSTCLKCHGTSSDTDENTLAAILERYPKDQATNYALGDFRGAWKIEFEK
jgi:hypothetical protein